VPYKNDCCPKNRSRAVEKNAPYKHDCGEQKSEPNSVRLKNAPYKNDCGQKNRNKTVEKQITL